MPFIHIEMMEGRTIEQRRRLVELVTKAVCDSVDVTPQQVRIILSDIKLENYGINAKLALDNSK